MSTPEPGFIWVLVENGGYEGHRPPLQATATYDEAVRLRGVMSAGGADRIEIFKVPMWPMVDGVQYRKPVEEAANA